MYLHGCKERIRSGLYIPGEIALRKITVPGAAAATLATAHAQLASRRVFYLALRAGLTRRN
jgi:hypothetical protein